MSEDAITMDEIEVLLASLVDVGVRINEDRIQVITKRKERDGIEYTIFLDTVKVYAHVRDGKISWWGIAPIQV